MTAPDPALHLQPERAFEQHPRSLNWRALCSCGWACRAWRASPDRAQRDWQAHRDGDSHD